MRIGLIALIALLLAPPPIHITSQSRSLQPGELVVLSIVLPEASDRIRVHAFDREVAAYPAGAREWRRLDVRVRQPSATVKARSGYFGG